MGLRGKNSIVTFRTDNKIFITYCLLRTRTNLKSLLPTKKFQLYHSFFRNLRVTYSRKVKFSSIPMFSFTTTALGNQLLQKNQDTTSSLKHSVQQLPPQKLHSNSSLPLLKIQVPIPILPQTLQSFRATTLPYKIPIYPAIQKYSKYNRKYEKPLTLRSQTASIAANIR